MKRDTRFLSALRLECQTLRYVGATKDLSALSDAELSAFLKRIRKALGDLAIVTKARDLGPKRLSKVAAGGVLAILGVASIGAVGPIAAVGAVIGGLIALDDALELAAAAAELRSDEMLVEGLEEFMMKIDLELERRGL